MADPGRVHVLGTWANDRSQGVDLWMLAVAASSPWQAPGEHAAQGELDCSI